MTVKKKPFSLAVMRNLAIILAKFILLVEVNRATCKTL